MLALAALAAAAMLSRAAAPEYVASGDGGSDVCIDPRLLIRVKREVQETGAAMLGQQLSQQGLCSTLAAGQRVFGDFIEDVPYTYRSPEHVDGPLQRGVARVLRGRRVLPNGVEAYFFGMAADFRYVGPP